MRSSANQPISGQLLVADFQNAVIAMATTNAAQHEAEQTEHQLVAQLTNLSRGNYLNPQSLGSAGDIDYSRASLDAHIKKIQAEQLTNLGEQQLANLVEQDQQLYKGKRVRIAALNPEKEAIESVWYDYQHGYRSNPTTKKSITGSIEEVLLDKNALVIRPNLQSRLLYRNLQHFIVYVIDPASLRPMIDVELL